MKCCAPINYEVFDQKKNDNCVASTETRSPLLFADASSRQVQESLVDRNTTALLHLTLTFPTSVHRLGLRTEHEERPEHILRFYFTYRVYHIALTMDDQPNKQEGSASPAEKPTDTPAAALTYASVESSMCSASTVGQSFMSNAMVTTQQQQQQSGEGTESLQRCMLEQQLYVLGLLSTGSFGTFLFMLLPYSALLALGLFVSSICALFYVFYRILMLEWNNVIQGRGIGQYLPSSMYELLTSTTLHEWMTDPTVWNEYRHLLLYFIPGITPEQLDTLQD